MCKFLPECTIKYKRIDADKMPCSYEQVFQFHRHRFGNIHIFQIIFTVLISFYITYYNIFLLNGNIQLRKFSASDLRVTQISLYKD